MSTRTRFLTGMIAIVAALALGGCAGAPQPVVTRLPTDGAPAATATPLPVPSATTVTSEPAASIAPDAPVDEDTDCGGAEKTLAGSSQSFVVTGDCPLIRIEGNAVTVDAANASVGTVTVSGDRIRLDAGAVGDTTLQGNDITVNAASAGALTIRGDRNTVTAPGGVGRIVLSGNDNVVIAPSGDVVDEGQRNTVR